MFKTSAVSLFAHGRQRSVSQEDGIEALSQSLAFAGNDAMDPSLLYGGKTQWKEGSVTVIPWEKISDLARTI